MMCSAYLFYQHTWIRDKRDSTVMPTTGYCIELTQVLLLGIDNNVRNHSVSVHTVYIIIPVDNVTKNKLYGIYCL